MIKGQFPVDKFQLIETPFYYYDTDILKETLTSIKNEIGKHEGFEVHYAIKANANPKILKIISNAGLGADCVSGGEIKAVLDAGFLLGICIGQQLLCKHSEEGDTDETDSNTFTPAL